jgi:LPS-assembly protein
MLRRLTVLSLLCWALTPAAPSSAQGLPLSNCKPGDAFSTTGPQKLGDVGFLKGTVHIVCDDTQVFADEVTWDEKVVRAQGSVLVVQPGLRVTAERMEMDRATHLGTFYKAAGTARLTDRQVEPSMFGTLEPEISFYAEQIEKTGPRSYKLTDGWFSTCVQANPRWDMRGSSGTVTLNEHVLLKNAVLRVKSIPVIYVPLMYYPLGEEGRSTGFLLPTYKTTSISGQGISNAFFWAINRSQDATFYHDWTSKAGQGMGTEYRFVSAPGSSGRGKIYMLNENERLAEDGSVARSAHRSYDVNGSMNQTIGRYLRGFIQTRYFTDASTNQLYQQNIYDASQRTRYVRGSIVGGIRRYRLDASVDKTDIFTNPTTAQRRGRLPRVSFIVGEQAIGHSRISFGVNTEVVGIQNQINSSLPETNRGLWRYDVMPTLRAPLSKLSFLSASASGSFRLTHWTDSLDPVTGLREPVSITRPLAEVTADVTGPVVQKVFQSDSGYAERFKHRIEPRMSVRWLSPFNPVNNVINNDAAVDCLIGGNTTVSYALFNRIYAKRRQAGGSGRVQEIFWTSISQSYYTQEGASACDVQYQNQSVGQFSSIQVTAAVSPTDALTGRFQMYIDSHTRAAQSYTASATALGRRGQITAIWSKRQFLPNVPGFNNPASAAHALTTWASLKSPGGRVTGNVSFQIDLKNKQFIERHAAVSYSAQCCGVSVDYQTVNIAPFGVGGVTDHRFNFSFTLAGIGTFSNPLGSFGR